MKNLFKSLFVVALIVSLGACSDLDVENENNADLARSLANANEFDGIVNGQFSLLFLTDTYFHSHTLSTMGDEMSMSWGNWGCRELSSEPRIEVPNSPTWNYAYVVEDPWSLYFSVIGSVNDVLRAYELNPDLITTDGSGNDISYQVKAKAKFLQGAAYGNLAKLYDQAKVVTEDTDLLTISSIEYSDYQDMATSAVSMLEEAITLANSGADFNIGAWNGLTISRDEFVQICRSWQAKVLIHNARNETENAAADWSAIASYAADGVDFDLAPSGDGGNSWYDYFIYYGNEEGWSRVDMRIVAMLANDDTPTRFPTDGTEVIGESSFFDDRGEDYWIYEEDIPFRAERGYYHYSHYDMARYDYHRPDWTGPMPYLHETENDLMLAEALIRSGGSKTDAATLINKTREDVGGLPALNGTESDDFMLEALFHERFVEMITTSPGSGYYDRRRLPEDDGSYDSYSGLQPCTPRSFPIPASELQLLGLEVYSFGGC